MSDAMRSRPRGRVSLAQNWAGCPAITSARVASASRRFSVTSRNRSAKWSTLGRVGRPRGRNEGVQHAHGDGARRPVQVDDKQDRPYIVPGVGEHFANDAGGTAEELAWYYMLGVELWPANVSKADNHAS
jgi:hypothetical protein